MILTIVVILIILLDQASKFFANEYLSGGAAVSLIPNVISLRYHENRGAAWGILADHRWVFMSISIVAILAIFLFLIYTSKQKTSFLFRLSLSFFLGGGIGNMIDRIALGYVIDFLQFDFIDFPIFNVADSFITIGACLMIFYLVADTVTDMKKKKHG